MPDVRISIEDCRFAAGILDGTAQAWSNLAKWHEDRGDSERAAECRQAAIEIRQVADRMWTCRF